VFAIEYQWESAGLGTSFTQISDFEWKTLPQFLHKSFARGVPRDVRRQLKKLKRLLEAL
jgi:hypothetical protein